METLENLKAHLRAIEPNDTMTEAGRKALLADFVAMLDHEAGSRSGEDSEDVHDMRVATRRMRSGFRLLEDYFKPKAIYPFQRRLRKVARALGAVRDLDVMSADLRKYIDTLSNPDEKPKAKSSRKKNAAEGTESTGAAVSSDASAQNAGSQAQNAVPPTPKEALLQVVALLEAQRNYLREELIDVLDSKGYQTFLQRFGAFLTDGSLKVGKDAPYTVNLTVPNLIFERLAAVRAFDSEIENADPEVLHRLRVEFKRLRYAVSYFQDVLGKEARDFIDELKRIQDHLGRLNDVVVAQAELNDLLEDLDPVQQEALQGYLNTLAETETRLMAEFPDVWKRFNTKAVQQKLGVAVVGI